MRHYSYPLVNEAFEPEPGPSASAVNRILEYMRRPDPWDYDPAELLPIQLEAFNERLSVRREQIQVVGKRADELGVTAVRSVPELVGLMLSPTTYRSYPDSMVTRRRWTHLLRWLDTVSTHRVGDIDVADATDIDDFLIRIADAGHRVVTTSGTTGKTSMLPVSPLDVARAGESLAHAYAVMFGIDPTVKSPLFYTGNRAGPYNGIILLDALTRAFSTPELTHTLFEERMRITEVSAAAALSRAMANGTATPSELVAHAKAAEHAQARAAAAIERFVDALAAQGDVPVHLWGQPYAFYLIMKNAQERGIPIRFAEGSATVMAGGLKKNNLPDGYEQELRAFYDMPISSGYGQSEITALYCECAAGAWHVPPSLIPVLTDLDGRVVEVVDDSATGVLSHFDICLDGRWGGITTSDWVTMRTDPCPCGLRSPRLTSCSRVASVADDKINCSGRIEMYVRGVVDEGE